MLNLPINVKLPEGFLCEEIRCDYLISPKMKAVWAVELDLLNEFQRVCDKYNLKYFGCAGTVLGAARHKGFIPWDDDIDLMMFREEYDKLCDIASKEFCFPYFFQTEKTDKGTIRGHAQLRNSKTTAILVDESKERCSFNQGIFIDIFPLDNLPNNDNERIEYLNELKILKHKSNQFSRYTSRFHIVKADTPKRMIRNVTGPVVSRICKLLSIDNIWYEKFERLSKKYNDQECKAVFISALSLNSKRFIWNKTLFSATTILPYEFLSLPVPVKYTEMLTVTYGKWETPCKVTSGHGGVIFDPYTPYNEYMKNKEISK